MSTPSFVEHNGVIDSVSQKHMKVRIVSESACASCHAKGACTAADLQDKVIDVYQDEANFKAGQQVILMGQKSLAPKAILLAYILPLILILVTLITTFQITQRESVAGILSLAILIPYFAVIYFQKDKLQQTFSFTIKELI